jgi:RNA polymerase sigma-70 factor (ECF subfamily)
MAVSESSSSGQEHRGPVFVTTHWSVVLEASQDDAARAQSALEHLCQLYWYPIYHYIRRQGRSMHDAQDLTQEFFARLLEKRWIASADPSRGRFRSFLLMVLQRFLSVEWRKAGAQKRAGERFTLPLPLETAETRYMNEPSGGETPEQAFERQWTLALLETVLRGLREDYETSGQMALYEALKPCLMGAREGQPYAAIAASMGMSEGAVKVAVHRLRARYRERLRAEIAGTVASPTEVEGELRHLFRVFSRQ